MAKRGIGIQAMQGMGGYNPQSYVVGGGKQRGGVGSFFLGKKPTISQIPTVTPQASQALMQLLQQALGGLQNPQQGFAPIAQQARTQFQQQTVPSIAERFSGLGAGAQGSNAFAQQLGQAGAGLEESLAAQGAQYGLQNTGRLLQQLQLALMPQFENAFLSGDGGFLSNLFGGLSGGSGGRSAGGGLGQLAGQAAKAYLLGGL